MATKLSSIRSANGDAAAIREILSAFGKVEGNKREAAKLLGVSERTLYRMIGELGAWEKLDEFCRARGFRARAGALRGIGETG